ncbi:DUF262 domain-containing protein [Paeniglutamicibacter sulfureus]|uniref:GmrSD restriction endonucleases N-terminal domain-containing protein n=1 Tax=Paeniglutamicibacter sulfureus TaxID=43666 RepID=A0ABU2BNK4_9MICC|nr:DUF262 domain-containing protein [Paeniglutamicibacter sulfureus]MDR7358924.1 hypothetical protein [Paeniglutamicibacter sulfureus]
MQLIEAGAFGLPDFQRPFSWGTDQVRSLLATVFMGWPAGLILLMEAPPTDFFAVRSLEGLSANTSTGFRHLILDGQQRATALAQAFGLTSSKNEPAWYLDVEKFEEGYARGDIEDAFVRRAGSAHPDQTKLLVPLSALRSPANFQRWRDQAPSVIFEPLSARQDSYDHVNRLWVDLLAGARRFQFPCSILPADMPLSSVAMIFEKLNTAGLSLDTFDLVVAHVYKDGHNLRAVWESEVADRPILRNFSPNDPLIAAELVAMVQLGNTRRSGLLSIDAEVLWNSWTKAIKAIESAARFLTDRAGILNSAQLPHRGILLALAGAAYDLGGLDATLEDMLLHWVFSRGLTERFNAAVNTRVVSEYRLLVRAARGENAILTNADGLNLVSATKRANSSIYLTLQAMIRRRFPSDYPDGLIAISVSPEWSRAFSILGGSDEASPDRALGVILGSARTEKRLREQTLRETYEQLQLLDEKQVDEFLKSQILPPLKSDAWDDVGKFLAARGAMFVKELTVLSTRSRKDTKLSNRPIVETEATLDLIRDWLTRTDRASTDFARLEVGRRVAETLYDQGKPGDAVAMFQLLLESAGPWSLAERVGLSLLQARALASSGMSHEAMVVLERAQRDATNSDQDQDIIDLLPHISAERGALLIDSGHPAEGVAVLWDQLNSSSPETMSYRLAASMMLDYASGLVQIGETIQAKNVVKELLDKAELGLVENFPDLAERAQRLVLDS